MSVRCGTLFIEESILRIFFLKKYCTQETEEEEEKRTHLFTISEAVFVVVDGDRSPAIF